MMISPIREIIVLAVGQGEAESNFDMRVQLFPNWTGFLFPNWTGIEFEFGYAITHIPYNLHINYPNSIPQQP
jgi:hypothetical protein